MLKIDQIYMFYSDIKNNIESCSFPLRNLQSMCYVVDLANENVKKDIVPTLKMFII